MAATTRMIWVMPSYPSKPISRDEDGGRILDGMGLVAVIPTDGKIRPQGNRN